MYYTHVNGVKAFVWHLIRGLRAAGLECELLKLHKRDEKGVHRIYAPGVSYRNISENSIRKIARDKNTRLLIATTNKENASLTDDLCRRGARVVIHSNIAGDIMSTKNIPIYIHRSLAQWVDGVFLPHPYMRHFPRGTQHKKTHRAVVMTRLDPKKGTDIVLEALTIEKKLGFIPRFVLYGDLMPFYGMELDKRFPGWKKWWRGKFAIGQGPVIAEPFAYMIDLTNRGAECGTQYTFFEAADAGATPVIHDLWCHDNAEEMIHRHNCFSVSSPEHLLSLPKRSPVLRENLRELLDNHDAKNIAKLWWKEMWR